MPKNREKKYKLKVKLNDLGVLIQVRQGLNCTKSKV